MWQKTLITSLLVLATCSFGLRNYVQQVQTTAMRFTEPYVEVKAGTSLSTLCQRWQEQQLLTSSQCSRLKIYSVINPQVRQIKAGVYAVKPMTLQALLTQLRAGKVAQFSLRLQEGKTLAENLQALQSAQFLEQDVKSAEAAMALLSWPEAWGAKPVNAEGLFFPETYNYTAHEKLSSVLKRSHKQLIERVEKAWSTKQANLPLKSPYELLILASIIEKESGYIPEKPLIASVFINRLQKNMRLQTDPTVIYGLGDRYQGDITRAFLQDPHPYNTYVHNGLPPGPISSVSQSSISAAAQPQASDKLYFVASGGGKHVFSSTLDEHNKNVRIYILGKKS